MESENVGIIGSLDRLVGVIDKIEKIESALGGFNIFHAAGLGRREIKHCQFLSFLLDPAENHDLGDLFLRAFLDECFEAGHPEGVSRLDLYLRDLSGATIRREVPIDSRRRIDLLITVPSDRPDRKKFIVAIEAKIGAQESIGQTADYASWVEKKFPSNGNDSLCVFLSKEGEDDIHPRFFHVTWSQLYKRFKQISTIKRGSMNPELLMTLDHYLRHLEREQIVDNESEASKNAKRIALELYKNHKDALDFIFEHRPNTGAGRSDAIQQFLQEIPDVVDLDDCNSTFVRFIPKSVSDVRVELSERWTATERPVLIVIENKKAGAWAYLMVGPIKDSFVRQKLIQDLNACFGKSTKGDKTYGRYTRAGRPATLLDEDDLRNDDSGVHAKVMVEKLKESDLWKNLDQIAAIISRGLSDQPAIDVVPEQ